MARLSTSSEADELNIAPVEVLLRPSISESEVVELLDKKVTWMTPILAYLRDEILMVERHEVQRLMYQLPRYLVDDNKLYKRGFSMPLLRCVAKPKCTTI